MPIAGAVVKVLDDDLREVPVGVVGQLAIAGPGVAAGYVNDAEQTRRKFADDVPGMGRVYLTGDLGRLAPDGDLDIVGRMDNEVKLRGVRVNLETTEQTAVRLTGISDACAVCNTQSAVCVLFVVAGPYAIRDANTIRDAIQAACGRSHMPDHVVFLDVLPRTERDKVDRAALLATVRRTVPMPSQPRSDALRSKIRHAWETVLGVPVDENAGFFRPRRQLARSASPLPDARRGHGCVGARRQPLSLCNHRPADRAAQRPNRRARAMTTASALESLVHGDTYRFGNPFVLWRWMQDNEPGAWQETAEFGGFWSINRYVDTRRVLRDPETFSSAQGILLRPLGQGADPGSGKTLALSDATRHTVLRGAVAEWFAPRGLRLLADAIDVAARRIVADAAAAARVDFVTDVAAKLPLEVVWTLFDAPMADRRSVTEWSMDAFCAATPVERSIAHLQILDYFSTLVEARRHRPGHDLVSVLATVQVDGELMSLDDVVLNCDNLLVGGTENVRLAMSGGMHALTAHPDQWSRLRDDFDRLAHTAVDEILRWTSSATHLVRTAARDVDIGERRIAIGDRVVLWFPAANRDPRQFAFPGAFDTSRTPNRDLALGAGPHHCVGVQLARMEIAAVLRELVHRVSDITVYGEPEWLDSIVVNGLCSLPVRFNSDDCDGGVDE